MKRINIDLICSMDFTDYSFLVYKLFCKDVKSEQVLICVLNKLFHANVVVSWR